MRKVEAGIEINASSSKVFDAFTLPELLQGWWGVERCLVEKKQGGLYSLAWGISKKGFHYVSTGIITVYIPGKELLIDHFVYFNPEKPILGPTYLRIHLTENNGTTSLLLTQGNYQSGGEWDWFYESVLDVWPKVLMELKKFIEK
jgi:uncharacterized protein YndB with AHSA1/START domain